MIICKSIINNKLKYKYIFCDIYGILDFFKINEKLIYSFENLMKDHRPNDKNYNYTKIFNEDIITYHINGFTFLYQFIYDPQNFEIITIARIGINMKSAVFSMVHTNINYRGQKFCQKNINLFINNICLIKKYKNIKIFSLYVLDTNIPAIKCYETCGFIIKSNNKQYYLMEKII
jgi:hypothetical protein